MSPLLKLGSRDAAVCPACQRAVYSATHVIRYHGDRYHAECVLYKPPARLARASRSGGRAVAVEGT